MALNQDLTYHESSHDMFETISAQLETPMVIIQDQKHQFVNDAYARLLGYQEPDALVGKSMEGLVRDDFFDLAKKLEEEAKNYTSQLTPFKAIFIHQNGHEVPTLLAGKACQYNGRSAVQVIVRDLSNQQANQIGQQGDTIQFRRIVDNVPEAILLLNLDFRFIYTSSSAEQLLGYEANQLAGFHFWDFLFQGDQEWFTAIQQQVENGTYTGWVVYRLKTANAGERLIRGYFLPITNQLGDVIQIQGVARDITEEEVRESLVEESQELAALGGWRVSGKEINVTDKVYDILEIPRSQKLSVKKAIKLCIDEHQPIIRESMTALLEKGKQFEHELKINSSRGLKWVRVNGKPYYTNGRFYQAGGTIQDITAHKAAIAERERFFYYSLEMMAVVKDGFCLRANKQWRNLLGWSHEELKKYPFDQFVHPDYQKQASEYYQYLDHKSAVGPFTNCLVGKNGTYRFVEEYAVKNSEENVIYCFARDVTEKKEAEEKVKDSENKFRALAEYSQVGLFVLQDWCFRYVNPKYKEITGYTSEELLSINPLTLVIPEQREELRQQIAEQVSQQTTPLNYNFQIKTKQGQIRYLEVLTSLITYKNQPAFLGSVLDITEQQSIINQLKESELFKEKVAETSPNALSIADYESFTYIYENGKFQELIGYSMEEINQMPNGFFDLVHPEDQQEAIQTFKKNQNLADGEFNQIEMRVFTKQSGYKWFLTIDTPFKTDEEGRPLQILNTTQDITALKQRETQLQESQKFIEDVTKNSPNFINIYDYEEGRFIYENRSIFEYLGYEKEMQPSRYPYFHPDDIKAIREFNESNLFLEDGQVNTIEYRMRHSNGDYLWFYNRDVVHKRGQKGNVKQVLGLIDDITAQKAAEQSLKQSEEYYRQLFQNAPIGIVTLDLDYRLVNCNEGFQHLFGYTQDELKGCVLDEVIVPERLRMEGDEICRNSLRGSPDYRETVRVNKQGQEFPVLVYGIPVFFEGKAVSLYGMYIDITERKRVEDYLRTQTDALIHSNAELEQFAYVTSHHLRSPVINLQSLIDLFDESELKHPENQYIFEKLKTSSEALKSTLEDLTYIVGKKDYLSRPRDVVDFNDIFREITETSLKEPIERKGAHVSADFSLVPRIVYLRSFLKDICFHLLSNALQFSSPEKRPVIHFSTNFHDHYICLKVSDNGIGVDLTKNKARIFELYKGVHPNYSGKGMGLYLVKYQVESLNGYIEVESKVGEGTVFYIYLPDFNEDKPA